jgi:DNA modification methylase
MIDDFGFTLNELELKGYGSPAKISGQLKLLDLPESVQNRIQQRKLTAAHGRALVKLKTSKEQEKMAKQIADFDLTAKRTEIRIDRYLKKGQRKSVPAKQMVPAGDIPGVYFKDSRDMSELPDKSVHLIVSSPPYYVGMEFEKGMTYAEHWENIHAVSTECARVLVPGGIMALNVGDIYNFRGVKGNNDFTQIQLVGHKYQGFLRKHQIFLTDIIIWVKSTNAFGQDMSKSFSEKTPHTAYRIFINHDPVYIFRKKGEREVPSEEIALKSRLTKKEWALCASGIWLIDLRRKSEGHPSIYPDELVIRLIKMFSYEGDTVLDPFLGSGTTIKVARELNREGIGYEREAQYKAVIIKKLGLETGKAQLQGGESMIDYSHRMLAADGYDADSFSEKKPEPAVFGTLSAETMAALLESGNKADDEDEEGQVAGKQG